MITYKIKINLQSQRTQYADGEFTTGDVRAYRLWFSFYDNGEPYPVTGCFLSVKGKRADGVVVTDLGTVTDSGEAYYDVKSDLYAVAGELKLEVALSTAEGSYITTKELVFRVREGYGEGGVTVGNNTPILAEILTLSNRAFATANTAKSAAEQAENSAAETRQLCANALTGSVIGENAVLLSDVSPVTHPVEVKVSSLNLLNLDAMLNECLVKNEDGSYTMTRLENKRFSKTVECFIPAGGIYQFMTVISNNSTANSIQFLFWGENDPDDTPSAFGALNVDGTVRSNGVSKDIVKMQLYLAHTEEVGASITFRDACVKSWSDNSKGYTPYVDPDMVSLKAYGKNLIRFPYSTLGGAGSTVTSNGITATVQADGGIKLTGSTTMATYIDVCTQEIGDTLLNCQKTYVSDGTYVLTKHNDSSDIYLTYRPSDYKIFITVLGNKTVDTVIYPQMELGTIATDYELYREPVEFTPDSVQSFAPDMSLFAEPVGVKIECAYNKDTNAVIEKLTNAIISLGGNV